MGCSSSDIRGLVRVEVYENGSATLVVSSASVACDDPSSPQMGDSAALNACQAVDRVSYLHKTWRTVSESGRRRLEVRLQLGQWPDEVDDEVARLGDV